ncbi:MAG: gliding motility-associated C-terminal domain-containing protein [Crocinitomicaceae bacterium]
MKNRIYKSNEIVKLSFLAGILILLTSITISREPIVIDEPNCLDNLSIPKEFSPEADSLNRFAIDFPCPPQTFAIQVYHPNGDRVYFSQDYNFSWDGNDMNAQPCETQVYSWKLNYKYNMQNVILKGGLLLLR